VDRCDAEASEKAFSGAAMSDAGLGRPDRPSDHDLDIRAQPARLGGQVLRRRLSPA